MAKKRQFVSQEYSTEAQGKNMREGSRRSRVGTIFAAGFFSTALTIGICLITFTIVFFFTEVHGTSMMHTFNTRGVNTDSALANRFQRAGRGDIIIVRHYNSNGVFTEYHIKRLIAHNGEFLHFAECTDTRTFEIEVNGERIEDPWRHLLNNTNGANSVAPPRYQSLLLYQKYGWEKRPIPPTLEIPFRRTTMDGSIYFRTFVDERGRYEFYIPRGYIFYIGDHRGGARPFYRTGEMSVDSTAWGPQPANRIVGVVDENNIIRDMTPIQWLWDRFLFIVTFRWVR